MGKVAKNVQTVVVDIPARLWQLGLDYLAAKEKRDAAEAVMAPLKTEGLTLLERADTLFMQFPQPDGDIKVQRVPTVRSTWDVSGLREFLQRRIAPKGKRGLTAAQVEAVFKVSVDENSLKTLLDAGALQLKDVQRYCRTEQGYSFRVDRIRAKSER